MSPAPLGAVLIGMGKVGAGYADDPVMARFYPYATHAQVLRDHPAFAWEAVVDGNPDARALAATRWRVPQVAGRIEDLPRPCRPAVAVLATPPESRLGFIERIPWLRAVLVEKPLGRTTEEAERFLTACEQRGILVQVNLWRRADETFRSLAGGRLAELIGAPQAVFGLYGNGLLNNGTHLIDFVRMLLGEVKSVQAVAGGDGLPSGPIPGDIQMPFHLTLVAGPVVSFQPLRFEHYRENGLDIWGEKGRIAILGEGLQILHYPRHPHRATQGEHEVVTDSPRPLAATVGHAFYRMYGNLAEAVNRGDALWSPGRSALDTARIVEAVFRSHAENGRCVLV
jgi:predicted dehydrogenase